jgi:hypothetical protein
LKEHYSVPKVGQITTYTVIATHKIAITTTHIFRTETKPIILI